MLIPLTLPPGVFRNGTRYQAKGRWISANRVRWHDGSMRPIGGWERKTDSAGDPAPDLAQPGEYVRDGHAWRANDKGQYVVWGTNDRLRWQKPDASIEDILDNGDGLTPGPGQPSAQEGYGSGFYGVGPYGVSPAIPDPTINDVGRWSFDTWGQNLLAMPDWEGKIYEWAPGAGNTATVIANAPTGIADFIVTQERIVMTIGSPSELRKVQWSDQEDNTQWTPATDNQAGDYVLPGDGLVIGIYRLRNQNLILTETDAWVARYIGPPYVYSFEKVGELCRPATRKAAAQLPGGQLVWLGTRNMWIFDGTVRELPCDLIDFLVSDIESTNVSKAHTWVNARFSEVWFHYPSVRTEPVPGSSPPAYEVEYYVTWNWQTGAWSQGELQRSASVGQGVYTDPQLVGVYGWSYWHERDGIAFTDNVVAEATSGPVEFDVGENNIAIRAVYPDSQLGNWSHESKAHTGQALKGAVYFTFEGRQMPTGNVIISPEYTYVSTSEQPIPVRFMARDVQIHVYASNEDENAWEWGNFRLDVTPGGRR